MWQRSLVDLHCALSKPNRRDAVHAVTGFKRKVLLIAGPRLFWAYLHLVSATSRLVWQGDDIPDTRVDRANGLLYAFWHGRQIILPLVRRQDTIHCLISASRDGEYVARIAALFGKKSIRGSSSKGSTQALKAMMRALRSGECVAITPDGPRGPANEVKPGMVQMAQALGTPIVPVAFDASRKKIFASWDRFHLPLPFSTIAIVFGQPVEVGRTESIDDACRRIKAALDNTTEQATQRLST